MAEENKSRVWTLRELDGKYENVLNLYIHPVSGISNRLKHIASYLHFCGLDYTLDLHWPLYGSVANKFFELFKFDMHKRINEINYDIFNDNSYDEGATWRLLLKEEEQKQANMNYIDFEYHNIPQFIKEAYIPFFENLKPSNEVQRIIDSVEIPQNTISVHIRHNATWKEWNRWAEDDINLFIEKMKSYDNNTNFILACADQDIYNQIKDIFKERIISIPNKQIDYSNNYQDVAELFLLSKGNDLIATYGSTFSEVGWWLSGCKQNVCVIGSADKWTNNGLLSY